MAEFSVAFTDSEGWVAAVEIEAINSFTAVDMALSKIRTTERGKKLNDISKIEVDLV